MSRRDASINHGPCSRVPRHLKQIAAPTSFSRPEGTFGFEEFRRDPEDRGVVDACRLLLAPGVRKCRGREDCCRAYGAVAGRRSRVQERCWCDRITGRFSRRRSPVAEKQASAAPRLSA
jgi:hypothetical protein